MLSFPRCWTGRSGGSCEALGGDVADGDSTAEPSSDGFCIEGTNAMTADAETPAKSDEASTSTPTNAFGWAQYLRTRATEARSAGNTAFAQHLFALALQLEHGSWNNVLALEREAETAKIRDWEDQWKHSRAWQIENQKQVIGLGQSAIRWFAVINAGAVVALLAFLGNVWTKGVVLEPFLGAMGTFAFGVVLATLAGAMSYLTQLQYGAESERSQTAAKVLHVLTIVVGLGSLVVFCMGSYRSLEAFRDQDVRPPATANAADRELERRNYPPPKRPPAEPPRPVVPSVPTEPGQRPAEPGK